MILKGFIIITLTLEIFQVTGKPMLRNAVRGARDLADGLADVGETAVGTLVSPETAYHGRRTIDSVVQPFLGGGGRSNRRDDEAYRRSGQRNVSVREPTYARERNSPGQGRDRPPRTTDKQYRKPTGAAIFRPNGRQDNQRDRSPNQRPPGEYPTDEQDYDSRDGDYDSRDGDYDREYGRRDNGRRSRDNVRGGRNSRDRIRRKSSDQQGRYEPNNDSSYYR